MRVDINFRKLVGLSAEKRLHKRDLKHTGNHHRRSYVAFSSSIESVVLTNNQMDTTIVQAIFFKQRHLQATIK